MRHTLMATIVAFVSCMTIAVANAGHEHHRQAAATDAPASLNCYDPSDPNEIRLWNGTAPGATGNDACKDVPYLKMVAPEGEDATRLPAIVIIPGGGYDRLSDAKEQLPVAEYFARTLHVKAFVLYYRLVQGDGTYRYPVPMWDGQRALNLIRHDARRLGIDPERIGLFGFSAGGHLASTLALHPGSTFGFTRNDAIDAMNVRPYFLGLGYPVISMLPTSYASPNSLKHLLYGYEGSERDRLEHELSGQEHVTGGMPPVFLFESLDDHQISPQNSVLFAAALRDAHVPADVHLFNHGVHGAGLAEGIPDEEAWPGLFGQWLKGIGFLDRRSR